MNDTRAATVNSILDQAETMGLFPAAAVKIRGVSSDPEATIDDMERAVSMDAALGAQILKLANSPFYGLPRKVATLHQAIFVLGFTAIQQLALSLALMSMGRQQNRWSHAVWQHSNLAAQAATLIARLGGPVRPQEAFVGGMLHDIGEMLLLHVKGAEYESLLARTDHGSAEQLTEEVRVFGCDHSFLGGTCLTEWMLPAGLCAAVRYHHDDDEAQRISEEDGLGLLHIVRAADLIALGVAGDDELEPLARAIAADPRAQELGLDVSAVAELIDDIDLD